MFFLDKLKDFYLYKNRKVVGFNSENKNLKQNNLLILASLKENSVENLLNENIIYKPYFQGYYVPVRFTTLRNNKVITTGQKQIYDRVIANNNTITKIKKTLPAYKKHNVIYDAFYELNANLKNTNVRGAKLISLQLTVLENILDNTTHTNKALYIPVPDNKVLTSINLNNVESLFDIFYMGIRKKLLSDKFIGTTVVLFTESGAYIKFKYNKELKTTDINKAFNKIAKCSTSNKVEEIIEDETPVVEELVDKSINNDDKVSKVCNLIYSKLSISKDRQKGINFINQSSALDQKISTKLNSMNVDYSNMPEEEILDILSSEEEIVKTIADLNDVVNKSVVDQKDKDRLKKKQDDVIFDGMKLKELFEESTSLSIDSQLIENENIVNDENRKSSIRSFDSSYENKVMKKDIAKILTAFNDDADIPFYLKSVETENTSDIFNKKVTFNIKFEDTNKVTHQIKLDYPILKDGVFMILNGGKKLLLKQLMSMPIIKTKPDTVQIATDYKKLFITRFGSKLNDGTINIKKLLSGDPTSMRLEGSRFNFKLGNVALTNAGYPSSLEFGEMSRNFINIEDSKYFIFFDQSKMNLMLNDELSDSYKPSLAKIVIPEELDRFVVGYTKDNKSLILSNPNNGEVFLYDGNKETNVAKNLVVFIVESILNNNLIDEKIKEFNAYKPAKTLTFTRTRIIGKTIPIIVILGYEKGLKNIMDRYGINYEFIKKDKVANKFGRKKVKFADGYLTYDSLDLKSTLLLDGITKMSTEEYTFEQMETKDPYLEYFFENCGSRNIGKGIHNFLSLMIDPTTKEILETLKLPTNIIDLILEGNTMLATSSYKHMNDMSCYRLRGAEQINAELYKTIADAFKTYKDTVNNGTPIKVSVPRDALIKKIVANKTVDEYSIINPSTEIDKMLACTFKGPSGINSSDAYTKDIRSYSKSMQGILAMSSPNSDQVGVSRFLSMDAKINNTRGFFDHDQTNRNGNTNICCPTELLNSFTAKHADPNRTGMQST